MKAIPQYKYIALHGYNEPGVRKTAHGIKIGDYAFIYRAADEMAEHLPDGAVLVPVPSHRGYATTTLALAKAISERSGAPVLDILRGAEREPLYTMKQRGEILSVKQLGFHIDGHLPEDGRLVFIDNVIATGTTIAAVIRAAGRGIGYAFAQSKSNLSEYKRLG